MPDAASPPARRGPIFIVGAMGSGTTLLRLVLDSHDHVAIPQETGFMRAYNAHRFTPFKWSGRNWAGRLGWSREEFDELMRELYDRMFMRYAEQHGKRRWGEKTPLHTWHVTSMARVFPDAQFVGMVRHPCGSVASNMRRFGTPFGKAIRHWSRYSREVARQGAELGDRFVLLRYEDLLLRPEPSLRELLDWLGEPWSDSVLEHQVVQAGRGGKIKVEGKSRVDEPMDVSRIARWTEQLTASQQVRLRRRVGALGRFYGYDAADPAALEQIAPAGRLLVPGAEMAALVDAHPELDLRTPGKKTPYDSLYDPRKLMILRRSEYADLVAPRGVRRVARNTLARIRGGQPDKLPERARKMVRDEDEAEKDE